MHSVEEVPPGTLPHLDNDDYALTNFNAVDVFSVISPGEDSSAEIGTPGSREAALDYDLWFVDLTTGTSTTRRSRTSSGDVSSNKASRRSNGVPADSLPWIVARSKMTSPPSPNT